jgi:hypothetical protein
MWALHSGAGWVDLGVGDGGCRAAQVGASFGDAGRRCGWSPGAAVVVSAQWPRVVEAIVQGQGGWVVRCVEVVELG